MSNKKGIARRAKLARQTVLQHAGGADQEDEANLRDLLADLLHLCDADGLSFNEELRVARGNYCAERAGEIPIP